MEWSKSRTLTYSINNVLKFGNCLTIYSMHFFVYTIYQTGIQFFSAHIKPTVSMERIHI